jgi:hypothetical protein
VQVTVAVPIGNWLPEGGWQVTVGLGAQLSVAVVVNVTIAPAGLVASIDISAEHMMAGC